MALLVRRPLVVAADVAERAARGRMIGVEVEDRFEDALRQRAGAGLLELERELDAPVDVVRRHRAQPLRRLPLEAVAPLDAQHDVGGEADGAARGADLHLSVDLGDVTFEALAVLEPHHVGGGGARRDQRRPRSTRRRLEGAVRECEVCRLLMAGLRWRSSRPPSLRSATTLSEYNHPRPPRYCRSRDSCSLPASPSGMPSPQKTNSNKDHRPGR